jgi:hypothetical protein
MKPNGTYDGNLQMFRQTLAEPDMARLRFMRWLAETGRLEHQAYGAPAGEFASDDEAAQP